jgi:hypothetical protein
MYSSRGNVIIALLLGLGKADISEKSFRIFCMIIMAVEDEQAEREVNITVEFYHDGDTLMISSLGLFGCKHEI